MAICCPEMVVGPMDPPGLAPRRPVTVVAGVLRPVVLRPPDATSPKKCEAYQVWSMTLWCVYIYIWYNYNYNVLEYCSFSYVCHDSTLYYVKRAWRDAIWYVQRHIMVVGRNTHLLGCPSSRAGAGNMLWDWSRECGSKSFAYCTNAEFLREWQLFNKSNRWRLAVWCSYVFIRS